MLLSGSDRLLFSAFFVHIDVRPPAKSKILLATMATAGVGDVRSYEAVDVSASVRFIVRSIGRRGLRFDAGPLEARAGIPSAVD